MGEAPGRRRVHALALQEVGAIDGGGADADADVGRPQRGAGRLAQAEDASRRPARGRGWHAWRSDHHGAPGSQRLYDGVPWDRPRGDSLVALAAVVWWLARRLRRGGAPASRSCALLRRRARRHARRPRARPRRHPHAPRRGRRGRAAAARRHRARRGRTAASRPRPRWCSTQQQPELFVLDVRTPAEFNAGHIPRAHSIPLDELEDRLGELPPRDAHDPRHLRRRRAQHVGLRGAGRARVDPAPEPRGRHARVGRARASATRRSRRRRRRPAITGTADHLPRRPDQRVAGRRRDPRVLRPGDTRSTSTISG